MVHSRHLELTVLNVSTPIDVYLLENLDHVYLRHLEHARELVHTCLNIAQLQSTVLIRVHLLKHAPQVPYLPQILHHSRHKV